MKDTVSLRVFISYRRAEAGGVVRALRQELEPHLDRGCLFHDVDSMGTFVHLRPRILEVIASCDVLIAVIGPQWLTVTDDDGRRKLDDPEDYVHLEIDAALRGKLAVWPVLVDGAQRPREKDVPSALAELTTINALVISDDRWSYDVGILLQKVEEAARQKRARHRKARVRRAPAPAETKPHERADADRPGPSEARHSRLPELPAGLDRDQRAAVPVDDRPDHITPTPVERADDGDRARPTPPQRLRQSADRITGRRLAGGAATLAVVALVLGLLLNGLPTGSNDPPPTTITPPATGALGTLDSPAGIAVAADGSFYVADLGNSRVQRYEPGGAINTIAGTGTAGYSGDGGSATRAQLSQPTGVALGEDGSVYISDSGNHRVRRVDRGTISTVAGTGEPGFAGDGGPAQQAMLNRPTGLAVGRDAIYVADTQNDRIRRIDRTGTITTVAGTGMVDARGARSYGDGGPASDAGLYLPQAVAVAPDGTIYVADSFSSRVRRIDGTGIITAFAGSGDQGFSGDGGPTERARLDHPEGLALYGNAVYIADYGNHRVRRVRGAVIDTVVGNGENAFSGDAGRADRAALGLARGVAVGADGTLYVTDTSNDRVRRVDAPTDKDEAGTIRTVAGGG